MANVSFANPLANQVTAEAQKIQQDQAFIHDNKNNPTALAGRIDEFQADFKNFQHDSASLQQSGDKTDLLAAQSAEASVYDSFDASQADLKEAMGSPEAQSALAAGDPTLTHLQSGTMSLIDEGNANVLHLQQLNNSHPEIDPMLSSGDNTGRQSGDVYGSGVTSDGTPVGVISGGTASPDDVAHTADEIYSAVGNNEKGHLFGNDDA